MSVDDFRPRLAKILFAAPPRERLAVAAGEIAAYFGVDAHEVAYFQVDSGGRNAVFRWPPSNNINIPLKSFSTSLLSATAREQRGFVNNAFATTPHLHMFEHALDEREQRVPVQKIMSVPLLDGSEVRGILQVCRKGRTLAEAGADFGDAELQELQQVGAVLAQFEL